MEYLLKAENIVKNFPGPRSGLLGLTRAKVQALRGVSLEIFPGETLGVVGESGCGKSTLGRVLLNLLPKSSGEIWFQGNSVADLISTDERNFRKQAQFVFQDPFASLNPRMKVAEILAEPYLVHQGLKLQAALPQVHQMMEKVGLTAEQANRYPHEFSGGQRQRIGIARALSVSPKLVVLDEPVSALDVSIQAGIVNLLADLQHQQNLSYLFIAHDLSVVRHIADRVAVMYLGKIVELGNRDDIYLNPQHPYTQALISAVPIPDPVKERARERIVLTGDVPNPIAPPTGCGFRTRCWKATEICATQEPVLQQVNEHYFACHHPAD